MMLPFILVICMASIALVAKPIARWIAERPERYLELDMPERTQPRSAEEKRAELQARVISKVLWDTPEEEVLDWLAEDYQIEGDAAEAMLVIARRERVRAIRERTLPALFLTGLGSALTAALIYVQMGDEEGSFTLRLGIEGLFGVCFVAFAANLGRYISGEKEGAVDD